jgi:hypothetical protein
MAPTGAIIPVSTAMQSEVLGPHEELDDLSGAVMCAQESEPVRREADPSHDCKGTL